MCLSHNTEGAMIDKVFFERFAREWIDSWNSHDLAHVLSHYSDDFEMFFPLIIHIVGEPSGMLKGRPLSAHTGKKRCSSSLISGLSYSKSSLG